MPQYQRVHIESQSDFTPLFQLIQSLLEQPELSLSIREVVFRATAYDGRWDHDLLPRPGTEDWAPTEANRDVSQENHMHQALKQLQLSEEEEAKWVRSLTWLKPELVEERKAFLKDDPQRIYFDAFVDLKDTEFAYHAAALLLVLCPNIERLVYRDNMPRNPIKEILMRNNYDLVPKKYLTKMKHVVLLSTDESPGSDDGLYSIMDILDLFRMVHRLPNITSISAEAVDSPRGDFYDTLPPGTSNIKKVHVTHSAFASDVIAAMIRVPKALEELTYTTGGRGSYDGSGSPLYGGEISKALLCQKDSLIRLDLDPGYIQSSSLYDYSEEEFELHEGGTTTMVRQLNKGLSFGDTLNTVDEKEAQGPLRAMRLEVDHPHKDSNESMGLFQDFPKLTHLSISIRVLRDPAFIWKPVKSTIDPPLKLINALPPNLEYLLIRGYSKGDQPDLDEEIAEILKLKSVKFPKLVEIHGIDELIPEGRTIEPYDDDDEEAVWHVEAVDEGWLESQA